VVPLWPLLIALGLVAAAVGVAVKSRDHQAEGRVSHLLDAFRALGQQPSGAVRLTAWLALSTAGRLAAATAIGAALGIHQPLAAAVVIIPALDVAGLLPLTPGNLGVTSGAIAMALQAHGMSFTNGLAAGIAFHAVETVVGLMFGMASLVWLAPARSCSPGVRKPRRRATSPGTTGRSSRSSSSTDWRSATCPRSPPRARSGSSSRMRDRARARRARSPGWCAESSTTPGCRS